MSTEIQLLESTNSSTSGMVIEKEKLLTFNFI
jgi:hypothetical protein